MDTSKARVIEITPIKQPCSDCSLRQLCLPGGISNSDIGRLDELVRRLRLLPRNGHVFHWGDKFGALYAVRSGSVKTYTLTENGGEQITGFYLPGEIIGLDAVVASRHPSGAKALETASICEIPFENLEKLAGAMPALGRRLLRLMSREILIDEELLTLLGRKSSEERLAALLLGFSTRFKERGFSAREFNLSMSRNDIANYLGLAAETVSRLFTRFQQQKLISVHNKYICLEDPERLRQLAGLSHFSRRIAGNRNSSAGCAPGPRCPVPG